MKIGTIIKKRRVAMKLTQEELAEKLNVTPQAVSRWENEISLPGNGLEILKEVKNTYPEDLLEHLKWI